MAEIVNLRTARKARDRREKEVQAAANRALHGRTKAQRAADTTAKERREKLLDGARRDSD